MKARETERERKRRASERMRRERTSYAEIVFLQFNFECKKRRKDTKREMWGASEWSHGGQLRQSHSTNMTCT